VGTVCVGCAYRAPNIAFSPGAVRGVRRAHDRVHAQYRLVASAARTRARSLGSRGSYRVLTLGQGRGRRARSARAWKGAFFLVTSFRHERRSDPGAERTEREQCHCVQRRRPFVVPPLGDGRRRGPGVDEQSERDGPTTTQARKTSCARSTRGKPTSTPTRPRSRLGSLPRAKASRLTSLPRVIASRSTPLPGDRAHAGSPEEVTVNLTAADAAPRNRPSSACLRAAPPSARSSAATWRGRRRHP
jgi:hypothetical protein